MDGKGTGRRGRDGWGQNGKGTGVRRGRAASGWKWGSVGRS
ncbi:hypothetical protein KNP414_06888 [Paenibacillus mucilaginosus KNP414]|uniref:Uncharacterized protein n=1 Tax=Paenibacillus mucilaginosus (strain KNP414) TaxID=1036673 RepID=F8FGM9_PAEMK|nr:hypothetical protein KNP414_06888 [Paenibacillus mucilaginosus KNP414]